MGPPPGLVVRGNLRPRLGAFSTWHGGWSGVSRPRAGMEPGGVDPAPGGALSRVGGPGAGGASAVRNRPLGGAPGAWPPAPRLKAGVLAGWARPLRTPTASGSSRSTLRDRDGDCEGGLRLGGDGADSPVLEVQAGGPERVHVSLRRRRRKLLRAVPMVSATRAFFRGCGGSRSRAASPAVPNRSELHGVSGVESKVPITEFGT